MAALSTGCIAAVTGLSLGGTHAAALGPTGCTFDPTAARLTVTNSLGGSIVFDYQAGEIVVYRGSPMTCAGGDPTVNTVDEIVYRDNSPASVGPFQEVAIDNPDAFGPGASNAGDAEPGNPDEIEWKLRLGAGTDVLSYSSDEDPNGANIRAGANGINHAVGDSDLFVDDIDVDVTGAENLVFSGNAQPDLVSGMGGKATGGPTALGFVLPAPGVAYGMLGGGGGDELIGGRGNDIIVGQGGADVIGGGPGRDTASYLDSSSAVELSIDGEANDGGTADGTGDDLQGSIENLTGGDFPDFLIGDDSDNVLRGGAGGDEIRGRGGDDTLKAKDGVADVRLDCGSGNDSLRRDALDSGGRSCERVRPRP